MASLAETTARLEAICTKIDMADGDITDEMMEEFAEAKGEQEQKVENWIAQLDALKGIIEVRRAQRDRAVAALQHVKNYDRRLRDWLQHHIDEHTGVPFKCEKGTLYTAKNPQEAVSISFQRSDKTIRNALDMSALELEPELNQYVKWVSVPVLDTEKVKNEKPHFAKFVRGRHVRIKA